MDFEKDEKEVKYLTWANDLLGVITKLIALGLAAIIIGASGLLTYSALWNLAENNARQATLDALFVLILIELIFAIRSFIKRGRVNVGILINVAVIAAVKQLIFELEGLDFYGALSFAAIFISLGALYYLEILHYQKKN